MQIPDSGADIQLIADIQMIADIPLISQPPSLCGVHKEPAAGTLVKSL